MLSVEVLDGPCSSKQSTICRHASALALHWFNRDIHRLALESLLISATASVSGLPLLVPISGCTIDHCCSWSILKLLCRQDNAPSSGVVNEQREQELRSPASPTSPRPSLAYHAILLAATQRRKWRARERTPSLQHLCISPELLQPAHASAGQSTGGSLYYCKMIMCTGPMCLRPCKVVLS